MVRILTEPKNSLVKQYKRLFEMENCELEAREDALRLIAKKAMERKTGARGLRTILEHVLLDTMYELPSDEHICKVVIDEKVVQGDIAPYLIYRGEEKQCAAGGE